MENRTPKIKVLFVCLGNICRSPSAEAVMKAYCEKSGLSRIIECDSAGTIGYHAGEPAYHKMRQHGLKRGYNLTSISRQIKPNDFMEFDYIIGMDDDNLRNMQAFMPSLEFKKKISKMTDYCAKPNPGYVPDPYYGGSEEFEQVLDILEDACSGLISHISKEKGINL